MTMTDINSLKNYAIEVNNKQAYQSFLDGLRDTQDPDVRMPPDLFISEYQFYKGLLRAEDHQAYLDYVSMLEEITSNVRFYLI